MASNIEIEANTIDNAELYKITPKEKKKEKLPVINPNIYFAKYTAPISTAIQKAIDDNKQGMLYIREDGQIEQRGIVTYNNRKGDASIIFKNFWEMDTKEFKEAYNSLSTRSCGKYTVFTKKIFAFAESRLFEQYEMTNGNTVVIIPDKEIYEAMGKSQSYYSQRVEKSLLALRDIVLNFKEKGKGKKKGERDLIDISPITAIRHKKGITLIEFHSTYARHLSQWGYTQYNKALMRTDDNRYIFAFDLGQYICELAREGRTEVKVRSIYERVQKIPRIDIIKQQRGSILNKIFVPFENNRQHLNNICSGVFQLNYKGYENAEDEAPLFENENGNFDEEKWLDTMMTITWNKDTKPNYDKLFKNREKYANQIEAPKKRKKKK